MSRRRTGLALVAAMAGAIGLVSAAFVSSADDVAPSRLAFADVTVSAPSSVLAGEPFDVSIDGLRSGADVEVLVRTSYTSMSLPFTADGSEAVVALDSAELAAGLVVIDVVSEDRAGTTVVDVLPGDAVGPLDLYLGPRTVIADGVDHSMLVAVPIDEFGNPVASGTSVAHRAILADGSSATLEAQTLGLLSFATLPATTVSGRTVIAVDVGDATGPGRSFENVPGPPVEFVLEAEEVRGTTTAWFADGTTLRTIRTSVLIDRYDNVVSDGTAVTLALDGPDGTSLLTSTTIDGVARFVVESPTRPGTITATASAADRSSTDLAIDVRPAIDEFEVTARHVGDRMIVAIGPVLLTTGFFVPDGTVAIVSVDSTTDDSSTGDSGGDVAHVDVVLDDGMGELIVDDAFGTPPPGSLVTVEILGVEASATIGVER